MKRWLMAALGLPGQGATPLAGPPVRVMATLPAEYRTRPMLRGMPWRWWCSPTGCS